MPTSELCARADALVLRALEELHEIDTPDAARERLSRALESLAQVRQAHVLRKWTSAVAVTDACLPIEDELISTQRALRRANSSLLHQNLRTTVARAR